MRRNIVAGVCLAVAAGLIVMISSKLSLDLESAALLGGALGAVVALVPDRTPGIRLGGFAVGFLVSWLGYVVRAALLPDTASGRAVAVVLVVLVCVALSALTRDRVPMWTFLLGTAAFAGGYEFAYDQAPQELMTTSVSTATTLLFNVAAGFLVATLFSPVAGGPGGSRGKHVEPTEPEGTEVELDELMGAGAR